MGSITCPHETLGIAPHHHRASFQHLAVLQLLQTCPILQGCTVREQNIKMSFGEFEFKVRTITTTPNRPTHNSKPHKKELFPARKERVAPCIKFPDITRATVRAKRPYCVPHNSSKKTHEKQVLRGVSLATKRTHLGFPALFLLFVTSLTSTRS